MITMIKRIPEGAVQSVAAAALCALTMLIAGCNSTTETIVGDIPDAENLFFTPQGRLFVSGGENVFEVIQKADGSYDKLDMFHEACLVEGIVQRGDYVYGVCSKTNLSNLLQSFLIAGRIEPLEQSQIDPDNPNQHPTIKMEIISPLKQILIPNGMTVDPEGNLYIADYGAPKIFKVSLNSPTDVKDISVWKNQVGSIVNGLKWVDDQLYFSAQFNLTTGAMGRIQQNEDGSAGAMEVLFKRNAMTIDDIMPLDGGWVISDYLKGTLIYWKDGEILAETDKDTFFAPTAMTRGQAPMFDPYTLLVTEKGIIGNSDPRYGNKLGLFIPQF